MSHLRIVALACLAGLALAGTRGRTRSAAPPRAVPPSDTARITLRLVGPTGAPLEGVPARWRSDHGESRDARSDADGRLAPDLPHAVELDLEIGGETWALERFRVAPLAPGEARALGELELRPGARLRGRVLERDGRPRPGARIELVEVESAHAVLFAPGAGAPVVTVLAGPDGTFSTPALGRAVARLAGVEVAFPEGAAEPLEVVDPAPPETFAPRAQAAGGEALHRRGPPGHGLVVEVVAPDGRAVPGAPLTLERGGRRSRPLAADAFGHAAWVEPGAGEVEVVFDPLGVARGAADACHRCLHAEPSATRARVEPDGWARVRLELRAEPVVRLRLGEGDAPAAGARAALVHADDCGERILREVALDGSVRADGAGRATLVAPHAGRFLLLVRRDLRAPPEVRELELGAGAREVLVTLPSGALSARVTDRDGTPLGHALVRLTPAGDGSCSLTGRAPGEGAGAVFAWAAGEVALRTGRDGRAGFAGLAGGPWTLAVEAEGRAPARLEALEIPFGGELDLGSLTLQPLCELSGAVRGARRDAVQVVELLDAGERRVDLRTPGADGAFHFAGLAPGSYRLVLHGPLVRQESAPLEVRAGAHNVHDVELR